MDNPDIEQHPDPEADDDATITDTGDARTDDATTADAEADDDATTAAPDPATEAEAGTGDTVEQVRTALRGVSDPELGLSIVDLGLVYDVELEGEFARVTMTLTSPGCPAGGQIMGDAKRAAESVDGVTEAEINLVWKPFWTPDRIDPKVRAMMGF